METDQPVAAAHQRMILHPLRAAVPDFFLRRLKNEENIDRKFLPQLREHTRRHQEHREMAVVPAGMHHPRHFRGKRQAGLFLYRQRVHIGPHAEQGPLALSAAKIRQNSRTDRALRREAECLQIGHDFFLGT